MRHTLVAAFATPTDASRTYGDLMSRGIAREQIHMVGADSAETHGYDEPYSNPCSATSRMKRIVTMPRPIPRRFAGAPR